jgi:hypothetical protein
MLGIMESAAFFYRGASMRAEHMQSTRMLRGARLTAMLLENESIAALVTW